MSIKLESRCALDLPEGLQIITLHWRDGQLLESILLT